MSKQRLFAIWKYKGYPGFLCGEITKFMPSGLVETKEYGIGNNFTPLKIIWGKWANTFKERIEALRAAERAALKVHDQDWNAKAHQLYDEEN